MEPLPSWAAQLEPVGFNWSVRGEQECNTSVAPAGLPNDFQPLKEPQKSSASCWTTNSNAGMSSKLSDQSTQDLMSIENQGQCWDPTPSMPEMDQEEALEFMSDYGLVGDQPAAEQGVNEDPAGLTQLAPATSDIDSAEGDSKATHDDSKLARSRGQPYTAEQKQVKARESQKRFRMRQKVVSAVWLIVLPRHVVSGKATDGGTVCLLWHCRHGHRPLRHS